jgi:hypothetical protein
MGNVYFLKVVGHPIREDLAVALFGAAQKLTHGNKRRERIRGRDFEGVVTTRFQSASLGDLTGTVFNAEIEMGRRKVKASYLVRGADMELIDPDQIEVTYGRDPRASNAHLN